MVASNPRRQKARPQIAADIRQMREDAALPQRVLADLFDWQRDALSKMETGKVDVYLYDYLALVHFFRDTHPDHPAHALIEYLFPGKKIP